MTVTTQQTRRPRPRRRTTGGAFARRPLPGLVAAGLTATLLLTGCGFQIQDRVCGSGHYPVKAVGNPDGGDCVADGQEPPEGWVRYPAGKVPEYVGDKWDRYWSTVVVDEEGRPVQG
ncbi:SCO0607 family lipoprotein [Streptomyces sp. NPDC127166]|uniref:SCO0607 family lipoprotein n=1 Tax=Streptomyces sp. NPDC127166 TaxID=3345380 RepID=UPI00362D81CE